MGNIPPSKGYLPKCIKLGGDSLKEGVNSQREDKLGQTKDILVFSKS